MGIGNQNEIDGDEEVFIDRNERTLTDEEFDDLNAEDQTLPQVTYVAQDFPVDAIVSRIQKGAIIVPRYGDSANDAVTAGFQRGFVWTKRQMDRFIESMLLGYPIPSIFLVRQQADNKLLVLDGQQRLETLKRFYEGLHQDRVYRLQYVSDEYKGKTYKELDPSDQLKLDDTSIQATVVISDDTNELNEAVYKIFERINSGGTQLTPHEIRVALYSGTLMDQLGELNFDRNWRFVYGDMSRRIRDHELLLRIFSYYLRADEYRKPLKRFLNQSAQMWRGGLPNWDEQRRVFSTAVEILAESINESGRRSITLQPAQLEATIVALMKGISSGEEVGGINRRIQKLRVDDDFVRLSKSQTTDVENVRDRHRRAFEILVQNAD